MLVDTLKNQVAAFRVYAGAAAKLLVADWGLLISDFMLATTIPYLVQFLIWKMLYLETNTASTLGFSEVQLLLYYAYAISLSRLNNGYDIIQHLSSSIHEGTLELQVVRPCPYPLQRLYDFLGGGLLYGTPVLLVFILHAVVHSFGAHGLNGLAFQPVYLLGIVFQFILSQILCFTVAFAIALGAFWLIKPDLLLSLITVISSFFGGCLLPPTFWSDWIKPIMLYNPFRYMIAAPAELMIHPSYSELAQALLVSISFIIFFSVFIYTVWKLSIRKYVSVGG